MKKLTLILLMTILLCPYCIYAEGQIIANTIHESAYPKNPNRKDTLVLRKYFKGNFTNSDNEEYIAFYYPKDDSDKPFFLKIIIYIVKDNKIVNRHSIFEAAYFQYDNIVLIPIKELEPAFGSWNGYYYSYDLNRNGINEIILFSYGGIGLSISIYEYKDNKIIPVHLSEWGTRLMHISVDIKEKSFSTYEPYEYEAHKEGYLKKIYK